VLTRLAPFLEGFTLFFWTTGSFWVPLLLVGGVWRHLVRRLPLAYEPRYWSLVFPLGMYAASTLELAKATALPLTGLAHGFFYAGLTAWTLTFLGILLAVARVLRGPR
jgi:tellurite resistance protein TehA-like permease